MGNEKKKNVAVKAKEAANRSVTRLSFRYCPISALFPGLGHVSGVSTSAVTLLEGFQPQHTAFYMTLLKLEAMDEQPHLNNCLNLA